MNPRTSFGPAPCRLLRGRGARLLLAALSVSALWSSPSAQALPNGGSVLDAISVSGESDSYTFTAGVGEIYTLQLADLDLSSFSPRLDVYDRDGVLITSSTAGEVAAVTRGVYLNGLHTVVVSDGSANPIETGNYELFFVRAPGANEGGALPIDGMISGSITLGDLDTFTIDAAADTTVELRVADRSSSPFSPLIQLFAPDGSRITGSSGAWVGTFRLTLEETGTYVVLISDGNAEPNQTGAYDFHFYQAPGANEEGPLTNGGTVTGFISSGDLDTWTFTANAGQGVELSLVDTSGTPFEPSLWLYAPDGRFIDAGGGKEVAAISATLSDSGTYIARVADGSSGRNRPGTYELHFVKPPTVNGEGPLVNGGSVSGTLKRGDLDTWTLDANAGESLELRVASSVPSGFVPRLTLFSPQGAKLAEEYSLGGVVTIRQSLPQSGTYTVLVADGSGRTRLMEPYELHFVHAPGANEGGALPNGGSVPGTISPGDLDSFTFDAALGEGFELRLADTGATSFLARLALYGPDGTLLGEDVRDVAALQLSAPQSGTYVVVVSDGNLLPNQSGTYRLHFARAPGAQEGGLLVDGVAKAGAIDLGDLDSFSFLASAGQTATVTLTRTSGTMEPRLVLYGVNGSKLRASSGSTSASLTGTLTIDGLYSLFVTDGGVQLADTGTYSIVIDGAGNTPTQYPNTNSPAELSGDPTLADAAGALTLGPRIGDALEPFNVSLDCTGATSASLYLMEVRLGQLVLPAASTWGWIWVTGGKLGSRSGPHGQGLVLWISPQAGITLPPDPSLLGVSYTAQGFCGGYGTGGRMSNALTQTIGG